MTAGDLVRATREAEGLTQAELARRLGITQPSVARLERAGDNVTVATLQRALRALGRGFEMRVPERTSSVDETLLMETLKLTPAQRLERFERWYEDMRELRASVQASRGRAA